MAHLWQTVVSYLQKPVNPDPFTLHLRAGGPLTYTELTALLTRGSMTDAGMAISETTALNIAAVWCAVKNIAGTVGTLPLILYKRRADGGRDRFDSHPLYRVLHDRPHPDMNAATFWTTIESHALVWGNGYAEIQRDGAGRVGALALLTPERVTPKRATPTGPIVYDVTNPTRPTTRLAAEEMFHVRGLSHDGVTGYSVIARARQGLGLIVATEKWGSSVFSQGPQWSGILQHPKSMRKETKDALRADLKSLAPHDFPMLEEGLTWIKTGMPADDMQYLETRQFQIVEIARWFNIPPHMLKDLTRATFSNIEEEGLSYLTHTIRPELVNIEQEVHAKLIAPAEQRIQYAEFLPDAILKGRILDRHGVYDFGRRNGYYSVNDVRRFENMNPIPEGDQYLVPANMVPAGRVDEIIDAQIAPDPAPAAPPALPPAPDADDRATRMLTALVEELRTAIRAAPSDQESIIRSVVEEIRVEVVRAIPPPAEPLALPDLGAFTEGLRDEIVKAFPAALPPPELLAPPPEPELEPDRDARRHAAIVTSHRRVVEDAVRRMFQRERDRMRPAAKSADRLRAWVGEFYARHADACCGTLAPGIANHCAYTGGDDPEAVTRALVAAWCAESTRQIHALLDRQPMDLPAEVEAMLVRWEVERLHGIPDAVMQEEMVGHG